MKRNLMVFTAITSLLLPLAAPVVASAQDRGDRGRRAQSEGEGRPQGGQSYVERRAAQAQAERGAEPAPQQRERRQERRQERREERRDDRQARPDRPNRPSEPQRPQRPDRPNRPAQPDAPDRPTADDRLDRQDRRGDNRYDRRQDRREDRRDDRRDDRRQDRRDDRRADRRDDRRDDRRAERRHDRREYREFRNRFNSGQWHRDWNRRHGSDWWRNDRRFRSYSGFRIGFYFAPGYGYYSVPRNYWGQRWQVGDYLPSMFWRYQLDDWRTYGLGYPPVGTRWVVVDNQIYLIDQYDGYIIDVIRDAWRW